MGFNWPLRIGGIIVIIIVAIMAAHFAGWDEWRWSRLSGVWWFWWIFGLSGGASLVLWLTPILHQPSIKWMSTLTAIDTCAPPELKQNFTDLTAQEQDVNQQIDGTTKEIEGKPQFPEIDALKTQLHDLAIKVNDLDAKRQQARAKIIDYLHEQLKSGSLLAKAYDLDKREEVDIPPAEWEYLQLGMEGGLLKEIGTAGGAGRHLTGVLLSKTSQ
jgi:hypothetical protein